MSNPLRSLDLIPAFYAVMEHGSLSAAARALGLSQPTVRRQVEALEAELAASLFTRAQNGLTPTPLAQSLLGPARAVLDEAHALARVATRAVDASGVQGTVRLTVPRVIAVHVLPAVLAGLRRAHPGLCVELAATDSTEDVLQRAADVAVRTGEVTQKALIRKGLGDVALGLFAAASMGEAPQGADDLRHCAFVSDDRDGAVAAGFAARGIASPGNVVLRCDDALAQIAAIDAGVGVGVCQTGIAARLGLVRVVPDVQIAMPVSVLMHEDLRRSPAVRAVFDHLVAHLPGALRGPRMPGGAT